ncbi:RNA 3'-terminal phosphate cyclase/enolpyruvate transferase, partial [Hyaloraphidium curvatum]
TRLANVPRIADVDCAMRLLRAIGCPAGRLPDGTVAVGPCPRGLAPPPPPALCTASRAAVLLLGLTARLGRSHLPAPPGGCAIGPRPLDMHVGVLRQMGAVVATGEDGEIEARGPISAARIEFRRPTVTGTMNALMLAALAPGESVIDNAALDPEVADVASLLTKMGASISGAGTRTIRIRGAETLAGASHSVMPDRTEAGTFMIAAAACGGDVLVQGAELQHLESLVDALRAAGCTVDSLPDGIRIRSPTSPAVRPTPPSIAAGDHPAFLTDLQQPYTALCCLLPPGRECTVSDAVYPRRTSHAGELARMGAEISSKGGDMHVRGTQVLMGATHVRGKDLRGAAALLIAALAAPGTTVVARAGVVDRGYEDLEGKLRGLGADVVRLRGATACGTLPDAVLNGLPEGTIADADLSELTTLHLPATCALLVPIRTADDALRTGRALAGRMPLMVLGGGSNVLFPRGHFPGAVLRVEISGRRVVGGTEDGKAVVEAGAGEPWDAFVRWTIGQDLGGLENLALIPGTAGGAPVQNVGAYGASVSDHFRSLDAVDLHLGKLETWDAERCAFGHRDSAFKSEKGRYLIISVRFALPRADWAWVARLSYPALAARAARDPCDRPTPAQVARWVEEVRRASFPDPEGRCSSGSFFKNPVMRGDALRALLARAPDCSRLEIGASEGTLVHAGWMIERCGLKGRRRGGARVSDKHGLWLLNGGGATGADVWLLGVEVAAAVEREFAVRLEVEPCVY